MLMQERTTDRLTHTALDTLDRLRSRLKARHLNLLVALDQYGSLSRVAKEWGVTQPYLTQALGEVESMVGAQLFTRARGGVTPTPLGAIAVSRAARLLADLEDWANDMAATQLGYSKRLNIGVIHYLSGQLLCDTLTRTREQIGAFVFSVEEDTSARLLQGLREHRLEAVVTRAWGAEQVRDLHCEILFHQRPARVCHPKTARQLGKRPLDWHELAGMDWLLPPAGTSLGVSVLDMFLRADEMPPVPAIETHSLKVVGRMIERNPSMVALVPADVAQDLSARAQVASVACNLDWPLPPVALYRRQGVPDSPTMEAFVRTLKGLCRERFEAG
ncbi:DNA-binding transcriptional LysR family regulator [Acidovorax soli]|uniref:DNA-binding transcriptional LysR family regulator n=2 Tax=Acidovorax soli TaxID=592050 RepID=A0A7X0U9H3_9BURK|nr:DNA-binding transcriptional LysR family regulator [Acidovorax soli]